MRPRFYVPDLDAAAASVPVPDDEAEHLVRVLRLGIGAEVEVLDGRGGLWRAEVVEAGKRSASVRAIEPVAPAPEIGLPIDLVISVLKADKMDDVVRDAVMLGATGIRPVVSDRSEITLSTVEKSQRVARWQRIAVSSAKQCGRAVVPIVAPAQTLAGYFAQPVDAVRLVCVEPAAGGGTRPVQEIPKPAAAHVIVGPEGGWTAAELTAALASGAMAMSLGGRTLRADAAPLVALTALLTTWSEL
ncbi:MAG: 16S rRNA (uracil(1498)-N(3))-methyltransferase [Acidobacteriota bacterium]|nr:16S rRNA (uracil(1498)-N(3))-methyltransferase [Acidobacteriota bacterium]